MNSKIPNDLSTISSHKRNDRTRNINIDSRISITLKHLNLSHLTEIFSDNKITFVDLLFLEYADYSLFNINENDTKRLFSFSQKYLSFGEEYSTEEVILFFNRHKEFEFQKKTKGRIGYSKDLIMKSGDYNKMNNNKYKWSNNVSVEKMEMCFICEKPKEYMFI